VAEDAPQVSTVIVTHDSAEHLGACLAALREATRGPACELVLVDNASRDRTIEIAHELFPTATVTMNRENAGFAAACNQGASRARGALLLFLNPDVMVDRGAVGALVEVFARRADVGLAAGRVRNPDGSFQATCREFPTVRNLLFSRGSMFRWLLGQDEGARWRYTLPDFADETAVPAVAATIVMARKELFERLGGFDRRFFMYMEDTDLSLRAHAAGFVNLFVPQAGGVHHWGQGSRAGRITRLRRHHVSVWRYFLKHFPNGFSVFVLPLLLAVNLAVAILFAGGRSEAK